VLRCFKHEDFGAVHYDVMQTIMVIGRFIGRIASIVPSSVASRRQSRGRVTMMFELYEVAKAAKLGKTKLRAEV
jgi:hypothetical protein